MRSTNTTNFYNNTLTNFHTNHIESKTDSKTETTEPSEKLEIKSSYSTYRPQYNINNLNIEKITEITKQRELAEKRNKEEMKEFLNEFGINRAKFKSEVEKKMETKNLIKFYEKNILETRKEDKSLEEKENILPAQLQEDNEIPVVKRNSSMSARLSLNANSLLIRKESIPNLEFKHKKSINPTVIENVVNIMKPINPIKINTNNIKNLNEENKIKINPDEVIVNIKTKASQANNRDKIFKLINRKDHIPSDLIGTNFDKVNDLRNKYSKMLNIKEIDDAKDNYKDYFSPLSAYDLANGDVLSVSPYEKKVKPNRPLTSYEFVRKNFDSNNLLEQRKTLSGLKFRDITRWTEKISNNKKNSKLFSQIQEAFLPYEENIYPKYYLPFPDYGMLSRPPDVEEKKKRADVRKNN